MGGPESIFSDVNEVCAGKVKHSGFGTTRGYMYFYCVDSQHNAIGDRGVTVLGWVQWLILQVSDVGLEFLNVRVGVPSFELAL